MATNNTNQAITISCELFWAKLDKVDQMSGKYSVKLCNISERAADALGNLGIEVKYDPKHEEYGRYVNVKSQFVIPAYDVHGDQIKDPLGNTTRANVKVKARQWEYQRKKGVACDIIKLTVTDFVPMASKSNNDEGNDEVL
jgi:hypothetical protein